MFSVSKYPAPAAVSFLPLNIFWVIDIKDVQTASFQMNQDIKEKWVEENPGPKEVMNWLMRNAWWMIVVGFFVLMGVCICFGLGKSGLDPFGPCKKKERNQPEISMNDVAAF